ncbi:MAG: hypothetical protein Q7S26_01700 [bacterium]|nr:hypothetical protein [bacterium]
MQSRNIISSGFVWLPVLLGILVVAILGGAYVYETQKPTTPTEPIYTPTTSTNPTTQNTTKTNTPTQTTTQEPISVPGMSKYTDTDFGFSFWYPSADFQITKEIISPAIAEMYATKDGQKAQQHIKVCAGESTVGECFDFIRVYSPTGLVMYPPQKMGPDPSFYSNDSVTTDYTMDGLRVLDSRVIPLREHDFILVGYWAFPTRFLTPLLKTIVATDPSVATPVSVAEQIKIIEAEKSVYVGQ